MFTTLHAKQGERRSSTRSRQTKIEQRRRRLFLETLEDRRLLVGVTPNDPSFASQWPLHNTGQTGGTYDADMDMPAAWSVTTGSTATVVAVLDSGVDYTHPDLYLNIWLNPGEIPAEFASSLNDTDGDAIITFRDLNNPMNAVFVADINANGRIDGGDLLNDPRWENGIDEDGSGFVDDLIGWDFHNYDNDPMPLADQAHGTDMACFIGAMGNNGLGGAGVAWSVRMMAVRVRSKGGLATDLINANAAAGIDYTVAMGAPISNNSWRAQGGGYEYSQEIDDAIGRARLAGHLFVTGAGNENSDNDILPCYPPSYDWDNIIVGTTTTMDDQLALVNYGLTTVDLGVPGGATSDAAAYATGVAALLVSIHPDWSYSQIKERILSTVDPLPALAGKCVTGGRLNAAAAVGSTIVDTRLFSDSFELGQWNGLWVQDSQNDWFTSTQRKTDGSYSAEVDGSASDAVLTIASPINLTPYGSAELTFDWLIESGLDTGEYVALDLFNGTSWQEVGKLRGNVDAENVWHSPVINIDGSYLVSNFQFRFRAKMSGSDEDANVDNVRLIATSLAGPPNQLPVAVDDAAATAEDAAATIDVLANDSDPDPDGDSNGTVITVAKPLALLAANSSKGSVPAADLTEGVARAAVREALMFWSQPIVAFLPPDVYIQVADIPTGFLGWASGNTITLDVNADGAGWYTDLGAPAAGRVDLLTVVSHEIGHLLGYGHSDVAGDLMCETLTPGTRRLPGSVPVTMTAMPRSAIVSSLLPEQLDVSLNDLVDHALLPNEVDSNTGADGNLWMLPLVTTDGAVQPQRTSDTVRAGIVKTIADEEAALLDEELLDLIAATQQ